MMSEHDFPEADRKLTVDLCHKYNPQRGGMAKEICLALATAREEGVKQERDRVESLKTLDFHYSGLTGEYTGAVASPLISVIAEWIKKDLGDAPNFREQEFAINSADSEHRFVVLIRRADGKTPAQLLGECKAELETARESARPPKGCVMDEWGEVVKYLGTPVYTKDGCMVCDGAKVYFANQHGHIIEWDVCSIDNHIPSGVFYSSEEAALAAKEAGK